MHRLVICPKCGQPFELEAIEKHVIDCRGKGVKPSRDEAAKAQASVTGASA